MARLTSHLHNSTPERLGGLALGTLVGYFSVLRGGPEPVFAEVWVGPFMRNTAQ